MSKSTDPMRRSACALRWKRCSARNRASKRPLGQIPKLICRAGESAASVPHFWIKRGLSSDYRILQDSDPLGLQPDHITGLQENWRLPKEPDSGWRTGADDITQFEAHDVG